MTTETGIAMIVPALGLPPEARVDVRVPKKLLIEQVAPTAADKRAIVDGIDDLQWLASCKPNTIGVPAFTDDTLDYLEIAVIGCAFRVGAKATRLVELIHRAIPYPVLLLTTDQDGLTVSAARKRRSQNEVDRVVIDGAVTATVLRPASASPEERAFVDSLALAHLPRRDLAAVYEGWLARIDALNASRLKGTFAATDDPEIIQRRRHALDASAQITRQITGLRSQAKRERQLPRRVDLNVQIQRLEAELSENKKNL